MYFSIIITSSALLAGAVAFPAIALKEHVVHERRERLPTQWTRDAKVDNNLLLPLRIALSQNNLDKAEEYLMDVSNPTSPNYGKHWTAQEVASAFAPSDITVKSVVGWLGEAGINTARIKQSKGLNWLHAEITVHEAERLLQTEYYKYTHADSGHTHIACEEYSIPKDIQHHIDFITPTVHFDQRASAKKSRRGVNIKNGENNEHSKSSIGHDIRPGIAHSIGSPLNPMLPKVGATILPNIEFSNLETCDKTITPACLQALYELPDSGSFVPNSSSSFAIIEYTPQAYVATDLDMFFRNYSPPLVGKRPDLVSIDGGYLQNDTKDVDVNGESNLDLSYAMALAAPQEITLYQVGDNEEGASFNNFLDALDGTFCTSDGGDDPSQDAVYPDTEPGGWNGSEACGGTPSAYVISSSYGYNEADLTPFYEKRQCNEYLKLGLQGATFLYSTGDNGVAGNGGQCLDPTNKTYNNGSSGMFSPSFPASCPYITAVGATQIKANASVTQPEVAAESIIFSGGGFSNVFDTPSYQTDALKTYFSEHKPPYGADRYNTTQKSRGFPDVSANGVNYALPVNSKWIRLYGTSASAPTFGAIITMINSARLDAGKGPVGFVNPALYANPSMMNDITSGKNDGCGTYGFKAVEGWDPVTGLGTPNFPNMLDYFLGLP